MGERRKSPITPVRIHIIPTGSAEPLHHAHSQCWCFPLLDHEAGSDLLIHNAKDNRERFERQGITLPNRNWCLVFEGPPTPDSEHPAKPSIHHDR